MDIEKGCKKPERPKEMHHYIIFELAFCDGFHKAAVVTQELHPLPTNNTAPYGAAQNNRDQFLGHYVDWFPLRGPGELEPLLPKPYSAAPRARCICPYLVIKGCLMASVVEETDTIPGSNEQVPPA